MNLSTNSLIREKIARNHLKKILLLLSPKIFSKRRFCSANIVYNLSFDDRKIFFINFIKKYLYYFK